MKKVRRPSFEPLLREAPLLLCLCTLSSPTQRRLFPSPATPTVLEDLAQGLSCAPSPGLRAGASFCLSSGSRSPELVLSRPWPTALGSWVSEPLWVLRLWSPAKGLAPEGIRGQFASAIWSRSSQHENIPNQGSLPAGARRGLYSCLLEAWARATVCAWAA